MDQAKEDAKRLLIRRINDFKPDERLGQMIEETINEIWDIFWNELGERGIYGTKKETNSNKSTHHSKRRSGARKTSNSEAKEILRCSGWRPTTPSVFIYPAKTLDK